MKPLENTKVHLDSISRFGMLAVLSSAAWLGAPALPASAAVANSNEIESITVTARRRDESQQSVPVAITAFSGAALAERSVTQLSNLGNAVPGVFAMSGGARGSNTPLLAIRGQLNRDPSLTADPSVGLYFADLPWARPGGSNSAFFDLQSVQVLKGPQGTLFGRNSTAGAILLAPKAPTDIYEGYLKVGGGDYGSFTTEAVLNIPIDPKIALRLGATHEQRDGYMHDVSNNRWTDDLNDSSFRGSLRFDPTGDIGSTFIGSYYRSSTLGDGQRLSVVGPASPSAGVASVYNRAAGALAQTKALGPYEYLSGMGPTTTSPLTGLPIAPLVTSPYARTEVSTFQNTTTWHFGNSAIGDLTFKNIVGYRHERDAYTLESQAVPYLAAQFIGGQSVGQISEEAQLQGQTKHLNYIMGLFYFDESGFDTTRSYVLVNTLKYNQEVSAENQSYSGFAHFDYDLGGIGLDRWKLTGGVRMNHDDRYVNYHQRNGTTPGTNPGLFTCPLIPSAPANDGSLCNTPRSVSFDEPTWDTGLNFKATDSTLLYASVGHGYRSGGWSEGVTSAIQIIPFQPEKVDTYELGAKTDWSLGQMPVRLNADIYYSDYSDVQRTIGSIVNGTQQSIIVNAAKAHIEGAEIDATIRPTSSLEITASYAYTKPKYDKFMDLDGGGFPVDVSRSNFVLISRDAFTATLKYILPISAKYGSATFIATDSYRSSFLPLAEVNVASCHAPGNPNPAVVYANCYNILGKLPGFNLVNFQIDWKQVMGQHFDASLFINNAFDKYYATTALNQLSSFGISSVQLGPPRMFGVSVTVPF